MADRRGTTRRLTGVVAAVLVVVALDVVAPVAPASADSDQEVGSAGCGPVIAGAVAGAVPGSDCEDTAITAGRGLDPTLGDRGTDVSSSAASTSPDAATAALVASGVVSGRVTEDGSGDPIEGALVVAVTLSGVVRRGTVAEASGAYALALPAGTYRLEFVDASGLHRSEWFGDRSIDDFAGATTLVVADAGSVTADGALAPAGASGSIGGTVTESGTAVPVSGSWVIAIRSTNGVIARGAVTATDGTYLLGGLEAGDYRVAVIDPSLHHAYDLFFDDKASFSSADDVAVSVGSTTTINPDLDASVAPTTNATITGTVTDAGSGEPVPGAWAAAVNSNTGVFTAATTADDSGRFSLAVPAGSYKVEFLDRTGGHAGEWFDDKPLGDFGGATPVVVTVAGTAMVNEDLAPLTGAIAGTVTETASAIPVAGAWVIALRAGDAALAGMGVADSTGSYRIGGLAADTAHRIAVIDPAGTHAPELFYPDQAAFTAGDAIPVTGGATATIDPDLDSLAPRVTSFTATVSDTNLITLTWRTEGGDPSGLLYLYDESDLANPATGYRAQNGTTSFRATAAGLRRFRLAISSAEGARTVVPVSVTVPFLTPPVITSTTPALVDEIDRVDVTVTWRHTVGGFARVTRPDGTKVDVAGTPSGSTITGSYLVTAASQTVGSNVYRVAFCKTTSSPNAPLCSEGARAVVKVGPQRFTGDYRQFVTPGQTVTLGWTGSGNGRFFNVSSTRLGLSTWSAGSSLPVTIPADATGIYDIALIECVFRTGGAVCANQDQVPTPTAGTIAWTAAVGTAVTAGAEVARVTTATSTISLTAPRAGTVGQVVAPVGATVSAGAKVVTVVALNEDHKQLIVSDRQWTSRPVLTDFVSDATDRAPVWTTAAGGLPLDVAYSPDGDLWGTGEFGWALTRWSDSGLDSYDAPLLKKLNANNQWMPVRPFSYVGRGSAARTPALVERITAADGKIWFTQGGDFFGTTVGNHSRVLSFDPAAVDIAATEDDERFCAVNVPNDGAEVVGLAFDGERIWFAESGLYRQSSVNSFDPDELPCDNLLDYDDANAVANAVQRYCTEPDQAACIRHIEVPGSPDSPYSSAMHLTYDPTDQAMWASDFWGGGLFRIDIATGAVQRWSEPPSDRPNGVLYGGAPWQIRADADYVYMIDYGDCDLVRFHKDTGTFDELPLPMTQSDLGAHSIELVGTRLWFTLGGGGGTEGTSRIGFVDTASWGPGVVYTGISSLVDTDRAGLGFASPGGIAVSPAGDVAFADYWRRQLVELHPRP